MTELLWWLEESRWARKCIPLAGLNLAPRELVIVIVSVLLGALVSAPLSVALHGLTLTVRAIVMGPFLLTGFIIASKRVKTLPVELQLFYRFVLRRKPAVNITRGQKGLKVVEEVEESLRKRTPEGMLVEEESFENPIPLSFTGKVRTPLQRKVFLYLDDSLRSEDYVSSTKTSFRVMYVPKAEDVGTHDLFVKVEGEREPVVHTPITVKKKNVQLLETKRRRR